EALGIEVLRVHDRGVDVGEHLELARAAHVVAVARRAVADDAVAVCRMLHLARLVGLDHAACGLGHAPDPAVALDAHAVMPLARPGCQPRILSASPQSSDAE